MPTFSSTRSQPVVLSPSTESTVYALFALAMGLTLVGVFIGTQFFAQLFTSGLHIVFLLVELVLIFTAPLWMQRSPLNLVLFALFPTISGITITPYIIFVLLQYANGPAILINAFAATACMALAAAVFARTTSWNLSGLGRGLFFAVLGLIVFSLLQLFIPSLRTGQTELLISGAGVVIFALFTAYDVQRTQNLARYGANPFLLALGLYLDIFNLFLYVLRFMIALSGERRRGW